jgi:decaprenylphospho-beta-D-ribofuranose 2-oxidase
VFMPPFLLNRYVMALYNKRRFGRYAHNAVTEIVGFNSFFHPLDSIGNWNKLYGKRGFFQYQCVIPETGDIARRLEALLQFLHQNGLFSFLAVLKYHRESQGFLTFPMQGYSLALDFPNTAHVRKWLPALDRWVADNGGRIYLAKDAQLSPELFEQMYGAHAAEWREIIRDLDPDARFSSLMSQRLQWKTAA